MLVILRDYGNVCVKPTNSWGVIKKDLTSGLVIPMSAQQMKDDFLDDGDGGASDDTGNGPDVEASKKLEEGRVVTSGKQAFDICERLVSDWDKGVSHAAAITSKLNGERPYNARTLKNQGKAWKTNISTGFLSTECNKIPPRFYMPVCQAKYLTAAQLPIGWPNGIEKDQFFRSAITEAIRSWRKWNFFIRGLSREVGLFGVGYAAYFDKYEWRPSLVRMDKGFVPTGTEIMDEDIAFFCVKWDYKPGELIALLRKNKDAGLKEWDEDSVVEAVNEASPVAADSSSSGERSYEELIRQSVESYSYSKGSKLVKTFHLFAREFTGKVSHYIVLRDSKGDSKKILYRKEDAYDSMNYVCVPMVFDYGDGTILGSWGGGQILFDMSIQVEKIRNDSIDNLRNQNKLKIQVAEAKDANSVKLLVNDTMMIVSGGTFNGAAAALPQNVDAYMSLDVQMTRLAQEKIGAYVPPIPLAPSDIKAAHVNAAIVKEQEIQSALLDNWLMQVAGLINTITLRLTDPDSPDADAKKLRAKLLTKLTEEEIVIYVTQPSIQTILDFTPFAAQQRAQFAASKGNNPLYNQRALELVQAESAGGMHFAANVLLPEGDQSMVLDAQRQQTLENAAMMLGMAVPVLPVDNDWVHAQVVESGIPNLIQGGKLDIAQLALQHYAAHYMQGVAKKQWPKEEINASKKKVADFEKALNEAMQAQAQAQQAEQAQQGMVAPQNQL